MKNYLLKKVHIVGLFALAMVCNFFIGSLVNLSFKFFLLGTLTMFFWLLELRFQDDYKDYYKDKKNNVAVLKNRNDYIKFSIFTIISNVIVNLWLLKGFEKNFYIFLVGTFYTIVSGKDFFIKSQAIKDGINRAAIFVYSIYLIELFSLGSLLNYIHILYVILIIYMLLIVYEGIKRDKNIRKSILAIAHIGITLMIVDKFILLILLNLGLVMFLINKKSLKKGFFIYVCLVIIVIYLHLM